MAKSALSKSALPTGGTFTSVRDMSALQGFLCALPVYYMLAAVVFECLRRLAWAVKSKAWKSLLIAASALTVIVFSGASLPRMPLPPASVLPTRWSDFAHWPNLAISTFQSLAANALDGVTRTDLYLKNAAVLGFTLPLVSLAFLAISLGCFKKFLRSDKK